MTLPLFTVAYWKITVSQLVHATAGAAAGAITAGVVRHVDGSVSVPWWAVLTSTGVSGLLSLLLSLGGQAAPNTAGPTLMPAQTKNERQRGSQ